MWAVNTKTGKMVWEYDASGCIDLGPCLDGTTAYFWRGQSFASVFWDRILPASGPCAVDCMTGRCLWRRRVLGYPASSRPFVVDELAFFPAVTEDTYIVHAYEKHSGELTWRRPGTALLGHSATALFCTDDDGQQFAALDALTGRLL